MTDETSAEKEAESDVEIDLATPDQVAYDELVEEFGEQLVLGDLEEAVKQRVRSLYDNQEQIRERIKQAEQQAAAQGR